VRWHRPVLVEAAVVAAAYAAGSLLLLGPVLAAPADRVYGLPSDPLGEVWRLDQFDRGEIDLVGNESTPTANAPSGVDLRRPVDATQILYDVPAALAARLLGPVLAYNVLVLVAFWSAAMATYGAMRLLGVGVVGSVAAGALFSAAPVHVIEAQLHVGLAQVFMLPALLFFGAYALVRPTRSRGTVVGAVLALCAYVTAYLLLEALVLAAGIVAAGLVMLVREPDLRRDLIRAAAAGAAVAAILISPLLLVLAVTGGDVGANVSRSLEDVAAFSLRVPDYVDRSQGSYIGLGILALAVAGLVVGRRSGYLRVVLGLSAAAGFLASLQPRVALLGLQIPMPSRLIHALVPYWRVFGRVEIVVALCLACLAGLALDRLSGYRGRLGAVLAVGVVTIALADVVERPPQPAADLGRPDPLASRLAHGSGALAEYPLWGFDNYRLGPYLFRQLRHGRPLLNGSVDGTVASDLADAANPLTTPSARAALTLAGVRDVVVHPEAEQPHGPGFRLEGRFPDRTALYAVSWSQRPTVASLRGAYDAEPGPDGTPFRWLEPGATLRVVARGSQRIEVTFDAVSPAVGRVASIGGADRSVSTAPTRIKLCVHTSARGTASLPVETVPPPQRLAASDPRVSGLGVYHLAARVGCRTPS
jgi:hypothetical protein